MGEQKKVWRDVQVAAGGWHEIGVSLELNELQLLESATHPRQTWAIDGDKWLMVNFNFPTVVKRRIKRTRLTVLVGKTEAVLLHEHPIDEAVLERLRVHHRLGNSPTGVLAVVADVLTEGFTPILDSIDEALDRLEDSMLGQVSDKQTRQLFHHKRVLSDLRRVVLPTMMTLNSLSDGRYSMIDVKYTAYLRDSYDYAWRAHELIDTQRDLLSSVLDTYLSVMSNRMNDIMKRLTIVATVFMPLSFITGFGGMNFVQLPFRDESAFLLILLFIIGTPLLMMVYFRHKGWM